MCPQKRGKITQLRSTIFVVSLRSFTTKVAPLYWSGDCGVMHIVKPMSKGILVATGIVILAMVVAQIALGIHPDLKEFSGAYLSAEEYRSALPEYQNHPLTKLREWWVANFSTLRSVFVLSALAFASTAAIHWFSKSGENA
jgi:hypothetical protein